MKTKTFEFDNLSLNDVIVVKSKDNVIDFSSESTRFTAYFNDSDDFDYADTSEILIFDNNQKNTKAFELPVKGKKMKLVIQVDDYDVDLVIAEPRS
jgi:hypothetical protein